MLHASCHCGAIHIDVPSPPSFLIDCNCSICRRLGGLWAYYDMSQVHIGGDTTKLVPYIWGDRTLRTMHCGVCGCVTHWEPLDLAAGTRMGVNARNLDPAAIAGITVRKFDGADTWTYLE